MSKLAILGGTPVRTAPFPAYQTVGDEEKRAVAKVLESGVLSKFLGCWDPDFYGGVNVRAFERDWSEFFGAKHSISVNSNTSGLFAAIGAVGVEPGDEVIVSPYSMSASAACVFGYGGVPVFADIDERTFCLDPASVEARITPRTKAIVIVDLFGHPFEADAIMALAERHGLMVIEDAAQAPSAKYKGRFAGTLGHIGVFSLNYHKHIHTGEGGMLTTDDPRLAERLQLIRNHGETVVEAMGSGQIHNLFGFNYRMTEMEAAVGIEQLRKLPTLMKPWRERAHQISEELAEYPGITPPFEQQDCESAYYVHACKFDEEIVGVPRNRFIAALQAELPVTALRENDGPLVSYGYVKPLYLQPIYQKRAAACSFSCPKYQGSVSYEKGLCPVTERMHEREFFCHEYMKPHMAEADVEDFLRAFEKVYANRGELLA